MHYFQPITQIPFLQPTTAIVRESRIPNRNQGKCDMNHFERVRGFLQQMDLNIDREDKGEELFLLSDEDSGIVNMVVDCEAPILIIEQMLVKPEQSHPELYGQLLEQNRQLIHGAFCLVPDTGEIIYRDTLQLENLDLNELEGSVNSLRLALVENADLLLKFVKGAKHEPV